MRKRPRAWPHSAIRTAPAPSISISRVAIYQWVMPIVRLATQSRRPDAESLCPLRPNKGRSTASIRISVSGQIPAYRFRPNLALHICPPKGCWNRNPCNKKIDCTWVSDQGFWRLWIGTTSAPVSSASQVSAQACIMRRRSGRCWLRA